VRSGPCNGWDLWHYMDDTGVLSPIDVLREKIRKGEY